MPIRPGLPYRIGTDIVHMNRITKIISDDGNVNEKRLKGLINRLFTPKERLQLQMRFPDVNEVLGPGLPRITQYLAGRFAAKEAVIKAFAARALSFRDIEIRISKHPGRKYGRPYAVVFDQPYFSGHSAGQAADFLSNKEATASEAPPEEGQSRDKRDFDGQMVQISISHDGAYATAMCIAPEEPMPGDVGGEAAARGFESDS